MIHSVTDALKLAGQIRPIGQSAPLLDMAVVSTTENAWRELLPFRQVAFERWERATRLQHNISAMQLVDNGFEEVQRILERMRPLLLMKPSAEQFERLQLLQKQLQQLQPSYLQYPLWDPMFNIIYPRRRALRRRFRLRAVSLLEPKHRDESLQLLLPSADGPQSVLLHLPANMEPNSLAQLLGEQLAPLGISLALENNEAVLECDDQLWQLLQGSLSLSGQGMRLPAGEMHNIRLEELLDWRDPREWRFDSNETLRQTRAKLERTQRRIEHWRQDWQAQQQQLLSNLSQQLQAVSLPQVNACFGSQLEALLAQANIGRGHAQDLLR
ncbi:hypothetical protein TUM17387_01400 [Shewanella carassii]|uniref:hypothetical protein n=1 Tax=Shewanella carassii TaxID=1987584 RepID=UPI001BEEC0E1|nr:hypothetical protein [Shewanella carassii]BCV64781.1 hypothetical protein TUM17387_01400 [Shewanella carassii]